MKRLFILIALLGSIASAAAQDLKSDNLQDFKKIVIIGNIKATLTKGEQNSMEMHLINSDIDRVEWSIKGDVLSVRLKPSPKKGDSSAELKITYQDINAIDTRGANVTFNNPINTGIFDISAGSGANISVDITASDLTVSADGHSATSLKGNVSYVTVKATTGAKVDARELATKSINAATQFSAEIFVWATEKLDAKASTSSAIFYKGTPTVLKVTEKLGGSVDQFSY